jgi:hypothetical protein
MYGPSIAEEFLLEQLGHDFLLDENGIYHGDRRALFLCFPTSDGDSKGANRLMRKQVSIIGPEAIGQSERLPCSGHVGKNFAESLYKLKENDKTFSGVGGLENGRIAAILHDIKMHLKVLKINSWDVNKGPTEEQTIATEKKVLNVLPHHSSLWQSFRLYG